MSKILSYLYSGWIPCSINIDGIDIKGMALNKGSYIVFNDLHGMVYRLSK